MLLLEPGRKEDLARLLYSLASALSENNVNVANILKSMVEEKRSREVNHNVMVDTLSNISIQNTEKVWEDMAFKKNLFNLIAEFPNILINENLVRTIILNSNFDLDLLNQVDSINNLNSLWLLFENLKSYGFQKDNISELSHFLEGIRVTLQGVIKTGDINHQEGIDYWEKVKLFRNKLED